jgi:hypothetical protein
MKVSSSNGFSTNFPRKIRKLNFSELFLDGKICDSIHWAVDRTGLVHRGSAAIAACPSSSELGLRPLWWPGLPDEGRRREMGAQGSRLQAHRGSEGSGAVSRRR